MEDVNATKTSQENVIETEPRPSIYEPSPTHDRQRTRWIRTDDGTVDTTDNDTMDTDRSDIQHLNKSVKSMRTILCNVIFTQKSVKNMDINTETGPP